MKFIISIIIMFYHHSFADELEGKGLICDDITAAGSLSYGFGLILKKWYI